MIKWLIYKRGPRDWRVSRGEHGPVHKAKSHAEAVRTMNIIVQANRHPPLAA